MSRRDEDLERLLDLGGVREFVRPYTYRDAETLMDDSWREVDAILKTEGIE